MGTVDFKQGTHQNYIKKVFEMQMPRVTMKNLGVQTENLNSNKSSLSKDDPQIQVKTIVVWSHHHHGCSREPKIRKATGYLG